MKALTVKQRFTVGMLGFSSRNVDRAYTLDCYKAAFTGQWEGYERNRMRDRPGRRTGAQDTDLNYGIREDLLSEARSLQQTEPITKRIINQYSDYCIGKCNARWNTGDVKIDAAYRANWKSWMKVCDYRGIHQFPKLMKLATGPGMVGDGNSFLQKVQTPDKRAMINMIEADRVSSSGIFNVDSDSMVGGIGLDPQTRRHQFIRVWDRTLYGTFRNPIEIPASDYLHLFDSTRVDAALGVTAFYAVLNAVRDQKEINKAEIAKTKRNSKLALLVKVITGQAPRGNPFEEATTAGATPAVMRQQVNDATDAYMFPNEDIKAHESNTPGTAWQGHMEFIIRLIALGVNLPFGVVWNMAGLGKSGVLFELEQAARTISAVQDEIENRYILPIIGWVTSVDIAAKRIPFHPNWYQYKVGRPAYISIDAGRDSKSAIAENLMGMKSATRWYAESGDEFEDEFEDCCREEAFRQSRVSFYKIQYANVRQMTPNGNPNDAGDPNKQSQSD